MTTKQPRSFLFVCTGNICRSPTAEAVFRHQLAALGHGHAYTHDSAGVASYHIGEAPDRRTCATARAQGIAMDDLRARAMRPDDFYRFDAILAMDRSHLAALQRMAPADTTAELALYLPYCGLGDGEVPDPYYGTQADFEQVLALTARATQQLLKKLGH